MHVETIYHPNEVWEAQITAYDVDGIVMFCTFMISI